MIICPLNTGLSTRMKDRHRLRHLPVEWPVKFLLARNPFPRAWSIPLVACVRRLTGRPYSDSSPFFQDYRPTWISVDSHLIVVCGLQSRLAIQQTFQTGFSKQSEVMQTSIDDSSELYAAIEARYPNGAAERFVIAYTCEQSLRELLAAPSIVASGCPTREHAVEICRGATLGAMVIKGKQVLYSA